MLIIGIAGGSGSGKSTVVREIVKKLPKDSVCVIPQDSYYFDNGNLSPEEKRKINFDHPSSIEFDLLIKQLDELKAGKSIEMPIYSYITCARAKETIHVEPKKVVIVEGILIFTNAQLRDRMQIKNICGCRFRRPVNACYKARSCGTRQKCGTSTGSL